MRNDPETYRRYAEECQRLATRMTSDEHKRILVTMAEAWIALAQEGERSKSHAE